MNARILSIAAALRLRTRILEQLCPLCGAAPGESCRSGGWKTEPHIARIVRAKRAAAPGPCPGCGHDLEKAGTLTAHVGTGRFDCES